MATVPASPLLSIEGLTKRFATTVANDHVALTVAAGEIHALLGENGAGKSTLVKMIYGVVRPDAGTMRFDGRSYAPASPADARKHGIAMVFQHFSLFDSLTVADNIALGLDARTARGDLAARIHSLGNTYGLALEPDRPVADLSVGERQRVEIVRALLQNPRLIIMDEPTSVLAPQEIAGLFSTLRRLAAEGRAVLYISHKLEEIRALCDRATVLRQGRVVACCRPAEESAAGLARLMLGSALDETRREAAISTPKCKAPRLVIDRLDLPRDEPFGVPLDGLSLEVERGEIVGIAGIAGNGQSELMAALAGEARADRAGAIRIDGAPVGRLGPAERRALGLAIVPEQRIGHAAVPDMTLWENAVLPTIVRDSRPRSGFIDRKRALARVGEIIGRFDVRTKGPGQLVRALSGGNLQKLIVGRELFQEPAVFIAAQPTWGVDAGSTAFIHRQILALAESGAAVLLVSQDLDELIRLSDRIAVLAAGRLSPAEPVASLTLETIGRRMEAAHG